VGRAGDQYERHADAVADLVVQGQSAEQELARLAPVAATAAQDHGVQTTAVQMDPIKGALTVSKRLMKWLGRESVKKQISKHVAKHGRQIAGKGVHTIFKNPNQIRQMARKAGLEALALAAANTRKAADEVLSGPGIWMFRQAAGPENFAG
jgi:cobyric acid synthase